MWGVPHAPPPSRCGKSFRLGSASSPDIQSHPRRSDNRYLKNAGRGSGRGGVRRACTSSPGTLLRGTPRVVPHVRRRRQRAALAATASHTSQPRQSPRTTRTTLIVVRSGGEQDEGECLLEFARNFAARYAARGGAAHAPQALNRARLPLGSIAVNAGAANNRHKACPAVKQLGPRCRIRAR